MFYLQIQKFDDKIVNIGALTMNNDQSEGESSLLMSPFQYISKSDMSDIMGDIGMTDLFSPRSMPFKGSNELALFPKSKLSEDEKENVISEGSRMESCMQQSFYFRSLFKH